MLTRSVTTCITWMSVGNSYTVTADEDKNIVNGQVVSRNEFGTREVSFGLRMGRNWDFTVRTRVK